MRARHVEATNTQMQHEQAARQNRELYASVNHGRPAIAATPKPNEFRGNGVVAARNQPVNTPATQPHPNNAPRPNERVANTPRPNENARPNATTAARPNNVPRPPERENNAAAPRPENPPAARNNAPAPAPRETPPHACGNAARDAAYSGCNSS